MLVSFAPPTADRRKDTLLTVKVCNIHMDESDEITANIEEMADQAINWEMNSIIYGKCVGSEEKGAEEKWGNR